MKKNILQAIIREEIAKCQLYRKFIGIGDRNYCKLEHVLKCAVECPYQGEVIWIERGSGENTFYFPYHECKLGQ